MEFTTNSVYIAKHCKVTETFGVITVDLLSPRTGECLQSRLIVASVRHSLYWLVTNVSRTCCHEAASGTFVIDKSNELAN